MSKPTKSQALVYLIPIILGVYILLSLLSFSFSMSEWNTFSNIIFFGVTVVLSVWTVNDYIIKSK